MSEPIPEPTPQAEAIRSARHCIELAELSLEGPDPADIRSYLEHARDAINDALSG